MENILGVAKISNIFWVLKFLTFVGRAVDAGPEPTYGEKIENLPLRTYLSLHLLYQLAHLDTHISFRTSLPKS